MESRKKIIIILSLFVLLVIVAIVTTSLGSYNVSLKSMLSVIAYKLDLVNSADDLSKTIIWEMRIPRILLVIAVGIALSSAGTVYQGTFRNPLVDPFILGVSSGAAFGAAIAIILPRFPLSMQLSAFLFSILGVFGAYTFARVRGQTPLVTLILAGIIINSLFSSLVSVLQYLSNNSELREIVFWLLGGFYYSVWTDVYKILPVVIVGTVLIWLLSWKLNILTLGDEEAQSLGINTERVKITLIILATLITSISVSTVGIIAWVGLMMPHAARLLIGPDHRYLIPASALMGGIFLLICDTMARSLTNAEIPIGILTSILGTPYLVFLIKTKRKIFFG